MTIRGAASVEESLYDDVARSYDAVLVVSFGGPEGPDDVLPFLENVTRGRPVPRERLLAVAEHYQHFGGVSPINEQNRALVAALRRELASSPSRTAGLFGKSQLASLPGGHDTADARRRSTPGLALVTSAFGCYSGAGSIAKTSSGRSRPSAPEHPRWTS
jgi:ferrochelatase